MNKKAKILFFCMIFAADGAFSQQMPVKLGQTLLMQQVYGQPVKVLQPRFIKTESSTLVKPIFLSPNFYANQLGFFCKQEIKLDKITRVPFRFRLGSVEDCNRLEGKQR